jgi:hypothetical protein
MPNFHLVQNVSFNVTVLEPWQSIFAAFNLNLIAEYEMLILLSGKQQTVPKLEGLSSNGGTVFDYESYNVLWLSLAL